MMLYDETHIVVALPCFIIFFCVPVDGYAPKRVSHALVDTAVQHQNLYR